MVAIDIDHLAKWIGKTEERIDIITPRLQQQFRATMEPFLADCDQGDAPLALHWLLSPDANTLDNLGPDGHSARGDFLPPVPLPRRMWAGGKLRLFQPLKDGDEVTRLSTIRDVAYKEGRSGPLLFVTVEREYSTDRGVAIWEQNDLVFREAETHATPTRAAPKTPATKPDKRPSAASWQVNGTPTMLFRYSALTFNGHRIHYDQPYATQEEFYDGLVVHGPLQASLMLNLAAQTNSPPQSFSYRGRRPLFAGSEFSVHISPVVDGEAECWVEDEKGQPTMTAQVSWQDV